MNALASLLLLAITGTVLFWVAQRSRPRDVCPALSDDERIELYRARLDALIGLRSEDYLQLRALGNAARARLLSRMRPVVPMHHALVPAGPVRVRYTGPRPKGRRVVHQRPLVFSRAA
jgi:hypothetical protein